MKLNLGRKLLLTKHKLINDFNLENSTHTNVSVLEKSLDANKRNIDELKEKMKHKQSKLFDYTKEADS